MSLKEKERALKYYETELERMMSDTDFERYGLKNNIIKYSELKNYNNINELLTEPFDFRIILIESSYNCGHWTAIIKYKNIIEYFNSYGTGTGYDFNFISNSVSRMLGQGRDDLLELLRTKEPHQELYYNKKRLQKNVDGINTCGRWVIARVLASKCGYELDDFIKKCEDKKKETGKPYDILVVDWIQ